MITIVTPALNSERYIEHTLRSIWESEFASRDGAVEHIVVDGGSEDATLEIVSRYPSRFLTGSDSGMYEAVNKGLSAASGEIFGYVNSDDELTPRALETVTRVFDRHPARQWLVAPTIVVDSNGGTLATLRPPRWLSPSRFRAIGWNCYPQPSTFFRSDFARALGGFDETFRLAGDYEFFLRALERERPIYVSQPLSRFRLHDSSLTRNNTEAMGTESALFKTDPAIPQWRRSALRLVTKFQVNLASPRWALGKRTSRIRYR